jgi:hypothetical protein
MYESRTQKKCGVRCWKVVRCFQNVQNILVDVFSPGKRCAAVDLRGNSVTAWGWSSGVPRNFVQGGSTNSADDRGQKERGFGGGSPLVRDSGGSCNLVQEISFCILKFF